MCILGSCGFIGHPNSLTKECAALTSIERTYLADRANEVAADGAATAALMPHVWGKEVKYMQQLQVSFMLYCSGWRQDSDYFC